MDIGCAWSSSRSWQGVRTRRRRRRGWTALDYNGTLSRYSWMMPQRGRFLGMGHPSENKASMLGAFLGRNMHYTRCCRSSGWRGKLQHQEWEGGYIFCFNGYQARKSVPNILGSALGRPSR